MQHSDREPPPSPVQQQQYNSLHQPDHARTSVMTTTMTQPRPSPYLHQNHHHHAGVTLMNEDYSAGGGNRATSPTVVVTTNQVKDEAMSPGAVTSTASSNSPASSPVSTGYHPYPAHQYCSQQPSSAQYSSQHVTFTDSSSHHGSSGNLHGGHYQYSAEQDPLTPQSAPVVPSAWPTFNTPTDPGSASGTPVPVPSEIHTKNGIGPTPYFPSIKSSGSLCSKASTATANSSSKAMTVTGKKKHMTKAVSGSSISSIVNSNGETTTVVTMEKGCEPVPARRQKRLERNRESARLSRRRRKQYLEVLEERVAKLSLDMDRGRREHSCMAIDVVMSKRHQVLQSALAEIENSQGHSSNSLERSVWLLDGPLSRTSEEFLILSTFFTEQLKSFALPSHSKFVLWLTLQGDTYFRGGRAASERLSAARIGERMLASGNDKVTPTNSMWPLVCNEVGLSYDQEERVRHYQRTMILQDPSTWLDRHTARSSSLLMQSLHDSVGSVAQVLGQRDVNCAKRILTPAQRIKFLAWAETSAHRIKDKMEARRRDQQQQTEPNLPMDFEGEDGTEENVRSKYDIQKDYHMAANLYILNHKLQCVVKDFGFKRPAMVTPAALKKLSRRPSFESLGQQKDAEGHPLSREDSFASSASLKNSTSMLSLSGVEDQERAAPTNHITPEEGELAAAPTVDQVLGFVKPVIPPIDPPTVPEDVQATTAFSAPMVVTQASTPIIQYQVPSQSQGYVSHDPPPPQSTMNVPAPPPVAQYVMHVQQPAQVPVQHYSYAPHVAPQHHPAPPVQHTHQHVPAPYEQSYQQPPSHYYPPTHQPPPPQHLAPQATPVQYTLQPAPVPVTTSLAPIQPTPSPAFQQQPPVPVSQPQELAAPRHVRKSSFLPAHLNVVPEDMFPAGEGSAEDFFVSLMDDEEWAIGEGVDMDTTH